MKKAELLFSAEMSSEKESGMPDAEAVLFSEMIRTVPESAVRAL